MGAKDREILRDGKPEDEKQPRSSRTATGVWRQNDGTVRYVKQGDLLGYRRCSSSETAVEQSTISRSVDAKSRPTGVRGTIVASKPGNAGGAKGSRKMDGA